MSNVIEFLARMGAEADLRDALTHAVAEAPPGLEPLDVLLGAFLKAGRILEENRPFSEPRLEIIAATPTLRERELAKAALLTDALTDALRRRGVPSRLAALAAQTGWAAFHQAAQRLSRLSPPSCVFSAAAKKVTFTSCRLRTSATSGAMPMWPVSKVR